MAARTKKEADEGPEKEKEPASRGRAAKAGSAPAGRSRPGPRRTSASKAPPAARPEPDDRIEALGALGTGLEEIVPGIEILDRDLEFDEGGRADLAAMDPSGRVYLVLVADSDHDKVALDVLDAHRFAMKNAKLLARHLGRVHGEMAKPLRFGKGLFYGARGAEVIVICLDSDERLIERLRSLASARNAFVAPGVPCGVRLFGVRTLKSAAGERAYLMPLDEAEEGAWPSMRFDEGGVDAFLDALPGTSRDLAQTLVERMDRLDAGMVSVANGREVSWSLDNHEIARLSRRGGELSTSLAPEHRPRLLSNDDDVDRVVDGALARVVDHLDISTTKGNAPVAPNVARAGGDGEEEELEDGPFRPGTGGGEDEPILTPEEIEAFHGG